MRFTLPIKPISTNAIWYGRKGITNAYKKFQKEVFLLLPRHQETITGLCEVSLKVFIKKAWLMSDVDNFAKGILDCCKKGGIIKDDRFIKKLTIEKFKVEIDSVEVEINKWK